MELGRVVVGYHGCDEAVAKRILDGEPFRASENEYDWLGHGVYFWEYGPDRALAFAHEQKQRGRVKNPVVVGALLQLGRCFDLLDTRHMEDLGEAYTGLNKVLKTMGQSLPENAVGADRLLRYRDCSVLEWYLSQLKEKGVGYDSVRCCFQEGAPAFEGSGILRKSHIQLAVRNPAACVLGVFRPTAGAYNGG